MMNDKLVNYLSVCVMLGACIQRTSSALGNILSVLSILLFLYLVYKTRKNDTDILNSIPDDIKLYQKMMLILIISMIPNIIFSYDVKDSLKTFGNMWIYRVMAFFIITTFIKDRKMLLKMLFAFLAIEAVESVWVVVEACKGVYRPTGFGRGVMPLSAMLVMVFPVLCVLAADNNFSKRIRKISLFLSICVLAGIIATQTRGAWLTLLLVSPLILCKYIFVSKKRVMVAIMLLAVISGFFVTSPKFSGRFKSITNITTDRSNADRILVWKSTLNMIKDHPITGVGLDCQKRVYKERYELKEITQDMAHSHNNFLQVYAEAGIFGFLGLLSFTLFMLWSSFKSWLATRNPYALMLFGVWSAFTLFGMIDNTIDGTLAVKTLWYLTGLLVVLKSGVKVEKAE